ncbi:MAG: monovalent cation/H+ antiporter complex subunit F [Eubacteriales bacterium]|nr:monovalent cation/H+ antiporter complex subunit F [Eubacteriales bacterium]
MLNVQEIEFLKNVFLVVFGVIGLGCIACLVYGVKAKRFTDRIVAVNIITTLSLNAICMLAIYLRQDYVLDIALIYALLSFTAVVVLAKLLGAKNKKEESEE